VRVYGSLRVKVPEYTTKELSAKTWPDLAKLFEKPEIGDAWWCWCTHHQVSSYSTPENKQPRTRAERAVRNRRQKEKLVKNGRAHGVIVYANGEPVGWCQYGPREELPRIDESRNYRDLAPKNKMERLWRITCFVVDKNHRKSGVASTALRAALDGIRNRGGGLVEGIPVSKTDQGPGYMYTGTVSMFERAGFKTVGPFGGGRTSTVVMRRTI
jgi:ribosomal protein S18 acetylase RimI-like enzyme